MFFAFSAYLSAAGTIVVEGSWEDGFSTWLIL